MICVLPEVFTFGRQTSYVQPLLFNQPKEATPTLDFLDSTGSYWMVNVR